MNDLVLLEKTEITAKTDLGEVTLVIVATPLGYSCAAWSGDKLLISNKIGKSVGLLGKASVIGAMLIKAKEHLHATHERHPDGLEIIVRVEHKGAIEEARGRIPLGEGKLEQLKKLFKFVRVVNAHLQEGNRR